MLNKVSLPFDTPPCRRSSIKLGSISFDTSENPMTLVRHHNHDDYDHDQQTADNHFKMKIKVSCVGIGERARNRKQTESYQLDFQ